MEWLKECTAPVITVGPILDTTGAPYTTAPATTDFRIVKNGTWSAMSTTAAIAHQQQGQFSITNAAADTDTRGTFEVRLAKADYAMGPATFMILPAATYDALVTNAAGTASGLPILVSVDSVLTIPACLKVINATSIAGTSTYVAAAFVAQYNVVSPVFTNQSVNQTGNPPTVAEMLSGGVFATSNAPATFQAAAFPAGTVAATTTAMTITAGQAVNATNAPSVADMLAGGVANFTDCPTETQRAIITNLGSVIEVIP
jgi:hypothetical protein